MMPAYGRNFRTKAIVSILMFAAVSCLPLFAQSSEMLPVLRTKKKRV
jgi:hypothetical protein